MPHVEHDEAESLRVTVEEVLVPLPVVVVAHLQHVLLRQAAVQAAHPPQREILQHLPGERVPGAPDVQHHGGAAAKVHGLGGTEEGGGQGRAASSGGGQRLPRPRLRSQRSATGRGEEEEEGRRRAALRRPAAAQDSGSARGCGRGAGSSAPHRSGGGAGRAGGRRGGRGGDAPPPRRAEPQPSPRPRERPPKRRRSLGRSTPKKLRVGIRALLAHRGRRLPGSVAGLLQPFSPSQLEEAAAALLFLSSLSLAARTPRVVRSVNQRLQPSCPRSCSSTATSPRQQLAAPQRSGLTGSHRPRGLPARHPLAVRSFPRRPTTALPAAPLPARLSPW